MEKLGRWWKGAGDGSYKCWAGVGAECCYRERSDQIRAGYPSGDGLTKWRRIAVLSVAMRVAVSGVVDRKTNRHGWRNEGLPGRKARCEAGKTEAENR